MTSDEVVAYIEAHIGGYRKSGITPILIRALIPLTCADLARYLLDFSSELSKKLYVTLSNQSWTSSKFSAPSDMLFYKQRDTTSLSIGTVEAFQIEDKERLLMINGVGMNYYALDGKVFFISEKNGSTSGSNLNITYYKIPTITDVDDELRNQFLELMIQRLVPSAMAQNKPKQSK